MKTQKTTRILFLLTALLFVSPEPSSAAEQWGISTLSFDGVTKVDQTHNPGIGANHVDLIIEGKTGNQTVSVTITTTALSNGALDTISTCKKDAMLVMHYPERYIFDVSSNVSPGNSMKVNVGADPGDYVICSIKRKIHLNVPASNLNNAMPAVPLTN